MMVTQRTLIVLALALTAPLRAQVVDEAATTLGLPMMFRWNETRTGYGYNSNIPEFSGAIANQLPAVSVNVKPGDRVPGGTASTRGTLVSPDLFWIFPFDVEGAGRDAEGNKVPLGNYLGGITSSPTVTGIDVGSQGFLAVMFGSETTVKRAQRNPLGSPNINTTDGTYDSSKDPYAYLNGQFTGCVYSLEAFSGTLETVDAQNLAGNRTYQPFWWYGVRNIYWYNSEDVVTNGDFHSSPSQEQHELFINASDTMVRAWDYAPTDPPTVDPDIGEESDGEKMARQISAGLYLAPRLKGTDLDAVTAPDGLDAGAGPVVGNRGDAPERADDRLHNLKLRGRSFGLVTRSSNGPLDNHFRLPSGMGAVRSTGAYVHLINPVDYTSRYYDLTTPTADRRRVAKLLSANFTTRQLYVVGSEDGYVYALDADPTNARKVTTLEGDPEKTTYLGRVVWTFRAAARVPVYSQIATTGVDGSGNSIKERVPVKPVSVASGETYPTALTNEDSDWEGTYVHVDENGGRSRNKLDALSAPAAQLVSGAVASSPVLATLPNGKQVILVGSGIGRLYCLDAETGRELWEFKTTPIGQNIFNVDGKSLAVDSVRASAINSSPSLGWVKGVASLSDATVKERLVVFFGAADGKVYALDVEDGAPIGTTGGKGWMVPGNVVAGTANEADWHSVDRFGFVAYAFMKGTANLGDTRVAGKYGRRIPATAQAITASIVLHPDEPGPMDAAGRRVPYVKRIYVAAPTNLQDADAPGSTNGGTIFALDAATAEPVWTFDRWRDYSRAANDDFDVSPGDKDQIIRPSAFYSTPCLGTDVFVYADKEQKLTEDRYDILYAIDSSGKLFAIDTQDSVVTFENRLYWRAPYQLQTTTGTYGLSSSPVLTTPTDPPGSTGYAASTELRAHSYLFVGVSDGIVAIDTGSVREAPLLDNAQKPLAQPETGGRMTWKWVTAAESLTPPNADPNDPGTDPTPQSHNVTATPAITSGYLWCGANNGLLYAWGHLSELLGDGWDFNNGTGANGSGRGPWVGADRPRQPMPDDLRPQGGATTTGDFYVDIFSAGWDQDAAFTPAGFAGGQVPVGVPPAITPPPVGASVPAFQTPQGGVLEWGDQIGAVAWGPELDATVDTGAVTYDPSKSEVTFRMTGVVTSANLRAVVEKKGSSGVARQIFYLEPFARAVAPSLQYPYSPNNSDPDVNKRYAMRNPTGGNPLTPGFRGTPYSITGDLRSETEILRDDGTKTVRRVSKQAKNAGTQTKFHLANPLNILAYTDGSGVKNLVSPTARATDAVKDVELDRNGNATVPVVHAVVGDHGTMSGGAGSASAGAGGLGQGQVLVQDRSHLSILASKAGADGANIYLRARVQPARLRWMGGPQAVYKPMFNIQGLENTWPQVAPPEPYYGPWTAQLLAVNQTSATPVFGAEQPPLGIGEDNISPDYPDIQSNAQSWLAYVAGGTTDAVRSDVRIAPGGSVTSNARGGTGVEMQVAVPKYQPANFAPASVSNPYQPGRGPGYYTVNPTNSSGPTAAALAWRPGTPPSGSTPYRADIKTAAEYYYIAPGGTQLPPSPSLIAQEPGYLNQIYVDTNGNGQSDNAMGEAYRMVMTGLQIRPTESLRVETSTIDVPRSPESYLPSGFIPFQYYWPTQVQITGEQPGREDPYLFGQRSLYTPFAVYNNGNVNLWSVRVDKFDPLSGHLSAPDVDTNLYAGASPLSNWPGSGVIKRYNLASTLDPLPIPPGKPGGPSDPRLFTPARKPRPSAVDDGRGELMSVKDVFPFTEGAPYMPRSVRQGLPYLTVAVPPGTAPGRYSTPVGRLVIFEDSGGIYKSDTNLQDFNGYLDSANGTPLESGVSSDATVNVTVGEARLTDKVSRVVPLLPNTDDGVAFARSNPAVPPKDAGQLAAVWQALAQDATPAGYRDPRTGRMAVLWSSNRVKVGGSNIPGIPTSNAVSRVYRIFGSAMNWKDPSNPPIDAGADVSQFLDGTLAKDPWGWQYQGGNVGSFWFPNFTEARWFGASQADPFLPSDDVLNAALGAVPGARVDQALVSYTSPAPITRFHGSDFPGMVFYVGSIGTGTQQRSAIFHVPVEANADGSVSSIAPPQAVGVAPARSTLDGSLAKYQPRPFLITAGGKFSDQGILTGEEVIGLGVLWFGGAAGRWELYVSTIPADQLDGDGMPKDPTAWKTTRLQVPEGVQSALHPSVHYRQFQMMASGNPVRTGVLEVAFSGYSRSGRNPDIYVVRYQALTTADGQPAIGNWQQMGFARRGASPGGNDRPLEPLLRDPADARPVYRSHWASWYGRRDLRPVAYWFKVSGANNDMRDLVATFQPRVVGNVARNEGFVIDATAVQPNGRPFPSGHPMTRVKAYFDLAAGSVRFTTTDPVNSPAPLSRRYTDTDGVQKQDFIYASFNPYALRVTLDSDYSDTMPQIWVDESPEVITAPGRTAIAASRDNPVVVKRDRMWVVWRRSAAPQGAVRSSILFYHTFRLAVDLGRTIPLDANGNAKIKVSDARGRDLDIPFTISPTTGRLFFTSEMDGAIVEVEVDGVNMGRFTIGWVTENPSAMVRYGDAEGGFRLPESQWAPPRTVPTASSGNDSQPFLFKDPFSEQLPPGTPGASDDQTRYYYTRGNNSMWMLWSSTRASRTMGNIVSSPLPPGPGPRPDLDPFYYSTGVLPAPDGSGPMAALTYSASASDVYFAALSPDFADK